MTRIQERFAGSPIVRAGAEVNPSLAAPLADFNRPASDLTLAELRPYLPPAIVLEAETALSALANEETQAWVTKCKLPGFVLRDSGQIAGVLPAAAVQQMLDRLPVAFDYGLPGEIITPTGKVVCEFCNTTNTVASLDPDNLPQCINRKLPTPGPHILKLGWL